MKVVFDWEIFSLQAYGGVSRYICRLADGLVGLGNDVHIFAPMHVNRYLASLDNVQVHGRRLQKLNELSPRLTRFINSRISGVSVKRSRAEIFHKTYYASERGSTGGARVIVTVHDMIHELFPEYYGENNSTSELKRKAVVGADHVICISGRTQEDLISLFDIPPEKTTVVPHGVDSFFSSGRSPGIITKPYILHVGERRGYKNFERFLRAFAASDRLTRDLVLVLFGGGQLSRSEKKLMMDLRLPEEQVIWLNGDDLTLRSLYQNAVAMIYPSLYEGFGLPLLEAMANGCPVVCGNSGSMPEVAGNAAEYFEADSIESICAAIQNVVYSEPRRGELVHLGLVQSKKYSWERCAKETEAVYKRLAEK